MVHGIEQSGLLRRNRHDIHQNLRPPVRAGSQRTVNDWVVEKKIPKLTLEE